VPVLFAPSDDTLYPSVPAFIRHRWFRSYGRDSYRFQLATDSAFSSVFLEDSLLTDTLKVVLGHSQNTRYWWRVSAKNFFGTSSWSPAWSYSIGVIGIKPVSSEIPAEFRLYNSYPNPFNPETRIKFALPPDLQQGSVVSVSIFDLLGREIQVLVNERLEPGYYEVKWDASEHPSGIYFCRITAGDYSAANKMVLVR